jgi:hypothetical protein
VAVGQPLHPLPKLGHDRIGLALPYWISTCRHVDRLVVGAWQGATSRTFGDRAIVTGDGHYTSVPQQWGGEAAPELFVSAVNLTGEQRVSRASVCRATGSRVADSSSSFYEEGFCAAETGVSP